MVHFHITSQCNIFLANNNYIKQKFWFVKCHVKNILPLHLIFGMNGSLYQYTPQSMELILNAHLVMLLNVIHYEFFLHLLPNWSGVCII
jgi:hypothetical protein